uniref:Uncharacterized protein n=1 Tax=Arundo donax TaxID=35708 RepID=A0A0A9E2P2_ARUDO
MDTTSLIDGRSCGHRFVHSSATRSASAISSRASPLWSAHAAASITSRNTPSPPLATLRLTQSTMLLPSPYSASTGRRPVRISSSTTPKLYTSLFSSTCSVYVYSGAM